MLLIEYSSNNWESEWRRRILPSNREALLPSYRVAVDEDLSSDYIMKIYFSQFIYAFFIWFLCRLPFWQRHIVFVVFWKNWHALKNDFYVSYVLKYFIELKSVDPKFSVYMSLSLSLSLKSPPHILLSMQSCFRDKTLKFLHLHNFQKLVDSQLYVLMT